MNLPLVFTHSLFYRTPDKRLGRSGIRFSPTDCLICLLSAKPNVFGQPCLLLCASLNNTECSNPALTRRLEEKSRSCDLKLSSTTSAFDSSVSQMFNADKS